MYPETQGMEYHTCLMMCRLCNSKSAAAGSLPDSNILKRASGINWNCGVVFLRCLDVVLFFVTFNVTCHTVQNTCREIRGRLHRVFYAGRFTSKNGSCNVLFVQFTIHLLNRHLALIDLISKSLFMIKEVKASNVVNG